MLPVVADPVKILVALIIPAEPAAVLGLVVVEPGFIVVTEVMAEPMVVVVVVLETITADQDRAHKV
jgi:hypothetical protein